MKPTPMSDADLSNLVRDAHIKFCLMAGGSFERTFADAIIAARDAQWAAMIGEPVALTDELVERAYKEIWRDLPSDFDYTAHAWIEQGMRYVASLADPQRLQGKGE